MMGAMDLKPSGTKADDLIAPVQEVMLLGRVTTLESVCSSGQAVGEDA